MEDENTVSSVTYPPLIVTTNDLERELHRPKTLKDRFNLNFLKKYKYYDVMKMESDRDVEGLLDLIKYKDYDYKIWALRILGELKEPRSILPLILLLKKDDYLRDKVIDTLIKIGEPTVDPLIASLDLMDYNINWGAIKALGELKAERAINPLIKMLKYKDLNFQTSKALSQIGDKAVDLLIELLNDYDVNVQINAIYALSYIESPKAIEPLIELLEDDDADVRLVAYQALQRMSKKSKQRLKEVVPITQEFNEYLYNEKKTENYYERLIRLY